MNCMRSRTSVAGVASLLGALCLAMSFSSFAGDAKAPNLTTLEQQVEYFLVKNLPGAYLLLHHIETCLLEVHPCLVITRNFSDLRGPIPSLRKLGARLGYTPRRSAS